MIDDINKEPNTLESLSASLKSLEKKVEDNESRGKIFVKRNYKLSNQVSLNIWLDCLYSELNHNSLLDFIEKDNTGMDKETYETKNSEARDIIINHLDDYYHNKVILIKDAKEILQKIKSSRAAEINLNATSVRAKLYQLKKSNRESVHQFCDRFEDVIREYEISFNSTPLTEIEKSAAFYQAVTPVHPELQSANLIQ